MVDLIHKELKDLRIFTIFIGIVLILVIWILSTAIVDNMDRLIRIEEKLELLNEE